MAKVRTFDIDVVPKDRKAPWGVPDKDIAEFITECEAEYYVNVTTQYIPLPTPRICVIVSKLDLKDQGI